MGIELSRALVGAARATRGVLAVGALLALRKVFAREGRAGVLRVAVQTLRLVPGVSAVLARVLRGEARNTIKSLMPEPPKPASGGSKGEGQGQGQGKRRSLLPIPEKPVPHDVLLAELDSDRQEDGSHCHDGKAFALVYYNEEGRFRGHKELAKQVFTRMAQLDDEPRDAAHSEALAAVFERFVHGNALNPLQFKSLRKYENEAVSMTAWMLHGDADVVGAMTSGGTESILMVIKAYREMARERLPHVTEPEIVAPITIHPAHEKAGHYFGVKIVHCKVDESTMRADVADLESLIGPNTIGIALSAPQYCHCVVDPIEEVAAIAVARGLPLHVDACYGGFVLPWIERLGHAVPRFDFRVPGVTSITADVHKYGFAPKGASFVLFRNNTLRKYMYYAYSSWPGGLYVSPSMAGTRPGANIAMAWATLRAIGQEGYMAETKAVLEATAVMKQAVRDLDGLALVADSTMSGFAFRSTDYALHIFAVADAMEALGWKMERQSNPDSLHCTIMPSHANRGADKVFRDDLAAAVASVRASPPPSGEGSAAIYGMVGRIPDKSIVDDFLKELISQIYIKEPGPSTTD